MLETKLKGDTIKLYLPLLSPNPRYVGEIHKSSSTLMHIAKKDINLYTLIDGKDPHLGIKTEVLNSLILEYIYIKVFHNNKFYETTRQTFKRLSYHNTTHNIECLALSKWNVGSAVLADIEDSENFQMDLFDIGKFEARSGTSKLKSIFMKSLENREKKSQPIKRQEVIL